MQTGNKTNWIICFPGAFCETVSLVQDKKVVFFFSSHLMLTVCTEIVLVPFRNSCSTEFIYGNCKINTALLNCASADFQLFSINHLYIIEQRLPLFLD